MLDWSCDKNSLLFVILNPWIYCLICDLKIKNYIFPPHNLLSSWNKNNPQNIFAMFYQYHKNYPFFLLQPFLHQSKENTITKFNVWSKIIPSWMNPKNTSFVWWCSITRQSISPMWWGVTWLQITSKFMAQIQ